MGQDLGFDLGSVVPQLSEFAKITTSLALLSSF